MLDKLNRQYEKDKNDEWFNEQQEIFPKLLYYGQIHLTNFGPKEGECSKNMGYVIMPKYD